MVNIYNAASHGTPIRNKELTAYTLKKRVEMSLSRKCRKPSERVMETR